MNGNINLNILPRLTSISWNKALIEKFPFMKIDEDNVSTYADFIYSGWWSSFGLKLCEELNNKLIELGKKENYKYNDFKIIEIKEKYGMLRIYAYHCPTEITEIIHKYEEISAKTCIYCGRPAAPVKTMYELPICNECIENAGKN